MCWPPPARNSAEQLRAGTGLEQLDVYVVAHEPAAEVEVADRQRRARRRDPRSARRMRLAGAVLLEPIKVEPESSACTIWVTLLIQPSVSGAVEQCSTTVSCGARGRARSRRRGWGASSGPLARDEHDAQRRRSTRTPRRDADPCAAAGERGVECARADASARRSCRRTALRMRPRRSSRSSTSSPGMCGALPSSGVAWPSTNTSRGPPPPRPRSVAKATAAAIASRRPAPREAKSKLARRHVASRSV